MAERNQLKIAELDVAADDPFAELTRIMGFDPRRQDPVPAGRDTAARPVEMSVEEDFGIDLEQELMGELQAGYGDAGAAEEAPELIRAADTGFDAASPASDGPAADQPDQGGRWASWRSPVPGHVEDAHSDIDLAVGDLAEELLVEEFEADQMSGAQTGHEFPALSLDEDELAKEFTQALEYGGDGEDELARLDPDLAELAGDPMPSAAEHAGDALGEEFRNIDLAGDGRLGDWPAGRAAMDADLVEDAVAFAFEPADDPASTAARMPLHGEDANAFEAAPAEFAGDEDRPVAWREADDGPEEHFSWIDPAESEPFDDPSHGQPADRGFAGEEPAEAEPVPAGYDYFPNLPESRGEQAPEPASETGEHAEPVVDGEFADDPSRRHAAAFGETEQWLGSRSSAETEADGFSQSINYPAPADATPDPAWDQTYASDEAGEPGVADASRLEPESSDVPFEDEDQEPHAAAEPSVRLDFEKRPDEFATDVATDGLLEAAPAAGAEAPSAPEFSLEDELNALLGNIKAVSRISAAAGPVHDAWSRADAWGQGQAALASTAQGPVRSAEGPGSEPATAGSATASSPAQDDLPEFDDEALELALAVGMDDAGYPATASANEGPAGEADGDPLDAIAAEHLPDTSASWDWVDAGAMTGAAESARAGQQDGIDFGGAVFEAPPAIETVEVADRPVALADDLDLPELDFQETVPPAAPYDDLDAEFASLLNDMNAGEPARPQAAEPHASARHSYGAYGLAPDAAAPSEAPLPRTAFDDAGRFDLEIDEFHRSLPPDYHAVITIPRRPQWFRRRLRNRGGRGVACCLPPWSAPWLWREAWARLRCPSAAPEATRRRWSRPTLRR